MHYNYKGAFCADDWGLSPAVNEGILRLAERGWLSSVSVLATGEYLEYRLESLLKLSEGGLNIFLHLNYTHGHSISSPNEVKTLLDSETQSFFSFKDFARRCVLGALEPDELRLEAQNQIQKLLSLGVPLRGCNGHHHIHLFASVYRVLVAVLKSNHLRVVRLMIDREHLASFLASKWFQIFVWNSADGIDIEKCRYLVPRNITTEASFRKKLSLANEPLLIHPALKNDFPELKISDQLQENRVKEFDFIMKYCSSEN